MRFTRRKAFGAGVRLLLALAALAAGQSTAARAEPASPRAAVVRTLPAAPAEALRSAEKRCVHRAAAPGAPRSAPDAPPLGATADAAARPLPLYLVHRALLI